MSAMISAGLQKSLADVTKRKGRAMFAILSIFLGIFALTGINFTEETLFSAYTYSLDLHTDRPDVTLQLDRTDPALLPQIAAIPHVQEAQFLTAFRTTWSTTSSSGKVTLNISSSPDLQNAPFTPVHLISGHYPGVGEIVLENSDAHFQSISLGETITVAEGQSTAHLKVVGLAQTPGQDSSTITYGYMSDAGLLQLVGTTVTASHFLSVKVSPTSLNHLGWHLCCAGDARWSCTWTGWWRPACPHARRKTEYEPGAIHRFADNHSSEPRRWIECSLAGGILAALAGNTHQRA